MDETFFNFEKKVSRQQKKFLHGFTSLEKKVLKVKFFFQKRVQNQKKSKNFSKSFARVFWFGLRVPTALNLLPLSNESTVREFVDQTCRHTWLNQKCVDTRLLEEVYIRLAGQLCSHLAGNRLQFVNDLDVVFRF